MTSPVDFNTWAKDLSVKDLLPSSQRRIIYFRSDEPVGECIKILDREMILSAPVVDGENRIIGFVDMLDFVLFVIGLFPKDVAIDGLTHTMLKDVVVTGEKYSKTPVSSVLELSNAIKLDYEHIFPVTKSTTIPKLMELFSEGVHRVPVVDKATNEGNRTLVGLVSQSDLIQFLAQCLPLFDEETRKKSIEELALYTGQVVTVPTSMKVIQVLMKMNQEIRRPILSAVPVVDETTGAIVANFSSSNLKGLSRGSFVSLLMEVTDYLTFHSEDTRRHSFQASLQHQKALHPLTISKETSFEEALVKLAAFKVHRLWVVDEMKRPVGVLSQGDIFKVFLPWFQPA